MASMVSETVDRLRRLCVSSSAPFCSAHVLPRTCVESCSLLPSKGEYNPTSYFGQLQAGDIKDDDIIHELVFKDRKLPFTSSPKDIYASMKVRH
jgi:hypothetical protein